MTQLYPLKFHPIFKERIWGGQKLADFLNKDLNGDTIGESWELSGVKGDISVIAEGDLAGKNLQYVLDNYGEQLLGKKNFREFGNTFPLLIKFIDAQEPLSIQLHPNDQLAKERHDSFGKTEMWFIMQADPDAELIVGFNGNISREDYLNHLENKTLPTILNREKVQSGDAYFIEVGRVHAIGAGIVLAEIQQTSDVTYRLYDWDRVDSQGNSRELHTELALDAIDFDMPDNYHLEYETKPNVANKMASCKYFNTQYLRINSNLSIENKEDSFRILIGLDGQTSIEVEGQSWNLNKGETILVPASIEKFDLKSDHSELLEVYV